MLHTAGPEPVDVVVAIGGPAHIAVRTVVGFGTGSAEPDATFGAAMTSSGGTFFSSRLAYTSS